MADQGGADRLRMGDLLAACRAQRYADRALVLRTRGLQRRFDQRSDVVARHSAPTVSGPLLSRGVADGSLRIADRQSEYALLLQPVVVGCALRPGHRWPSVV